MKNFFIILLSVFFTISSFAQEDEYDDLYYIPSKNIQHDVVKISNNYNLLIDPELKLTINQINFYDLSLVKRNQLVRNAYFDFHRNNHYYYGSYMWKLKYNYHIGYISYWDYQLYYDLIYWDSWYYNNFYYNRYYSYNWNYYQHIYNPKPSVRQYTTTHRSERPERNITSKYIRQRGESKLVNESRRVDRRVYSKVLPIENTNTLYIIPENNRTKTKPITTNNRNIDRSSNYSNQKKILNRGGSTIRSNETRNSTPKNNSKK